MTNAQKYKEVFGFDPLKYPGKYFCPPYASKVYCSTMTTSECESCRKWWDMEYIEPVEDKT